MVVAVCCAVVAVVTAVKQVMFMRIALNGVPPSNRAEVLRDLARCFYPRRPSRSATVSMFEEGCRGIVEDPSARIELSSMDRF